MTGQYFHNIDAKGRLFIPAKLREQLGDTLHVTVGQDGCLSVYSDTEWEKEVVVAGIFNRVEIWNAQRWAELEEEAFSSGSLEQAMEEMGL